MATSSIFFHRKNSIVANERLAVDISAAINRSVKMGGLPWSIFGLSMLAAGLSLWQALSSKKHDALWKASCVSALCTGIVAFLAFVDGRLTAQTAAKSRVAIAEARAIGAKSGRGSREGECRSRKSE